MQKNAPTCGPVLHPMPAPFVNMLINVQKKNKCGFDVVDRIMTDAELARLKHTNALKPH